MNKDLTIGEPRKILIPFCLPMFGSVIFQQLYNLADSMVAGSFIGENALAAVGNSYNLTLLFIAFAFGCNIGCSVIVSRYYGSREYNHLKTTVYTTFISTGVLCVALMVLGFIFCIPMLNIINTQPEILNDSALYLRIYMAGLPFLFYYNISTGIFTALGDSRTPFYMLAFSSTANIAADVLFVTVFKMGIAGLAWATFMCQGISCLLASFIALKRVAAIRTESRYSLFSFRILKRIAIIAIPSTLQQAFVSVGNMMIQSCINGFGIPATAGYSAAVKLNNLVITSYITIGNGISNYASQNMGAGKPERIRQGYKEGVRISRIVAIPFFIAFFFLGKYILMLFIEPGTEALNIGWTYLKILSPFYFMCCSKLISDGVLRGIGAMKYFLAGTFTDLILRVVLAFLLSAAMNSVTGVWLSWPVGWAISTAMSVYFYTVQIRKMETQRSTDK